jgi:transposase-like protein
VYSLTDREARRRLATTHTIEHDHAAVRRRARVVGVFPNEVNFLRLASALAAERNEQWLSLRYVGAAP